MPHDPCSEGVYNDTAHVKGKHLSDMNTIHANNPIALINLLRNCQVGKRESGWSRCPQYCAGPGGQSSILWQRFSEYLHTSFMLIFQQEAAKASPGMLVGKSKHLRVPQDVVVCQGVHDHLLDSAYASDRGHERPTTGTPTINQPK